MISTLSDEKLVNEIDFSKLDLVGLYKTCLHFNDIIKPFVSQNNILKLPSKRVCSSDSNFLKFYEVDKFRSPGSYFSFSFGLTRLYIEFYEHKSKLEDSLYCIKYDNFVFSPDFLDSLKNCFPVSFRCWFKSGFNFFGCFTFYDCLKVYKSCVDYIVSSYDSFNEVLIY